MLSAAALGLGGTQLGPAAPTGPATHTVIVEAVSYRPKVLAMRAGDAVVWVNKDPFPHTATSSSFDSKIIEAGKSWTYTPKARGEVQYRCTLHPTMTGTLRIQ